VEGKEGLKPSRVCFYLDLSARLRKTSKKL